MLTCSQPECEFAKSGVCLEGHQESCPHTKAVNEATAPPKEIQREKQGAPDSAAKSYFHSGEKLTLSEASSIMNAVPSRVVLVAGAQWAGKTTFLARIGEMFRDGAFKKYRFAASRSLCAFERASWFATISSGNPRPETLRTDRNEADSFYHLRVQGKEKYSPFEDVLISDLPGEIFSEIVASAEACKSQRAINRADSLVIFLDSQAMVDTAKRHAERDNVIGFIRRVMELRGAAPNLCIHVVFSRWDFVETSSERGQHEIFCKTLEKKIKDRFDEGVPTPIFWRIAARPNKIKATDDVIQTLFGSWLEERPRGSRQPRPLFSKPDRDFCAFGQL